MRLGKEQVGIGLSMVCLLWFLLGQGTPEGPAAAEASTVTLARELGICRSATDKWKASVEECRASLESAGVAWPGRGQGPRREGAQCDCAVECPCPCSLTTLQERDQRITHLEEEVEILRGDLRAKEEPSGSVEVSTGGVEDAPSLMEGTIIMLRQEIDYLRKAKRELENGQKETGYNPYSWDDCLPVACSRDAACEEWPRGLSTPEDPCCSDILYLMMSYFADWCSPRGVTHFLCLGTLLGAVRDRNIIPWTADVDIAVAASDYRGTLSSQWFVDDAYVAGFAFFKDPKWSMARMCVHKRNIFNYSTYELPSNSAYWDDNVYLDVYPYPDALKRGERFLRAPASLFFPVQQNVQVRDKIFFGPREPQQILEEEYGNWREPDHERQAHG